MRRVYFIILTMLLLVTGCGKSDSVDIKKENNSNVVDTQEVDTQVAHTQVVDTEEISSSWVADLEIAQKTTQMIVVSADGTYATVSMHTKVDGVWEEAFSVQGRVGKKGVGKEKEGDKKTPVGVYQFTTAFGILADPGITALPYLQVDKTHHWVDDSDSKYYNQLVSTRDVEMDWDSSEYLCKSTYSYKYVLALDYNKECVPGAGSAIFLHCPSKGFKYTSGCIAIPEENMKQVMQLLQSDCVIIIDNEENILSY